RAASAGGVVRGASAARAHRTGMTMMRLQRALARAGVTSRRKAEELIRAGRVRVDGQVTTLGMSVDPGRQRVTVDGRAVRAGPIAIDGRAVRVTQFRQRPAGRSVELELTLAEGRQRIVRRLAEALGLKVERLHRVAYGPVRLGRLQEGKYRRLAAGEIHAIERLRS